MLGESKSNFDNAIKKGQIIIHIREFHYRGSTDYNISNMKKYEITEKMIPIYKKWTDRKKWSKDDIVVEAKRKFQIYVENKKSNTRHDKRLYDGYIENW